MNLKAFFGLGSAVLLTVAFALVANAGPPPCLDDDSDGVCNEDDNCIAKANPGQGDADADGYGEACDPDTNNDCFITALDKGAINTALAGAATEPPESPYDLNEDGFITALDKGVVNTAIGAGATGPGPSGKACASCGTGEPTGPLAPGACP
jgi:hypothetical protein